jgi:cell division protein FtsN
MQQKFSGVLQNKTPDVQEANLGDKGLYHRLLIGPPSSQDQAKAVCAELRSAGHGSCWVTAY